MKKILIAIIVIFISIVSFYCYYNRERLVDVDINEVLRSEYYSYLPDSAKEYIKDVYEDSHIVLLTEKNKEDNKAYLNPLYIEYLEDSSGFEAIPSELIVDYNDHIIANSDELPSYYNLRNVNNKNYVTPQKNQGTEGICWSYATNAHLESHLLVKGDKEYDSSALIFSEKQIDYASSSNGTTLDNGIYTNDRLLADGGTFYDATKIILDGLGAVSSTWDSSYTSSINNHEKLENVDVFNFNNSLLEVNSTLDVPYLDFSSVSSDTRDNYINSIKRNIIENGGAYVATNVCYDTKNYYDGSWTKTVMVMEDGFCREDAYHALEIIGWDDNFEYTVCNEAHGNVNPDGCGSGGSTTGKGVWLLKNSWGEYEKLVLLGYDSYDTEISFITSTGNKEWDNFYILKGLVYRNSTNRYYVFSPEGNTYIGNENTNKIKMKLGQNDTYNIYISTNNGNSYTSLGSISSTFKGYYTFNIDGYKFDSNTKIKVVPNNNGDMYDMRMYTTNNNDSKSIDSNDISLDLEHDIMGFDYSYTFDIINHTRNISDNSIITYNIYDSNNNLISKDGYNLSHNYVYANTLHYNFTINGNYFDKGIYRIDLIDNEEVVGTFNLVIHDNLVKMNGDGSELSPFEVTNPVEFNIIRYYNNYNYILMNDIDFTDYDMEFYAIDLINGYFNGNNHSIINLTSNSNINNFSRGGVFNILSVDSNCNYSKCGIENLKVINPSINGIISTGGIVNELYFDVDNGVFNNNSVVGGSISNIDGYSNYIGGLVGSITISNSNITFNRLYNSSTITGSSTNSDIISGIIGYINSSGFGIFTINDSMNIGNIIYNDNTNSYSSLINIASQVSNRFDFNNIILINNQIDSINIINNSYLGNSLNINKLYTDSNIIDESINSNIIDSSSISIVEIANMDYTSWSNWTHNKIDNINRLPFINGILPNYTTFDTSDIVLRAGESIDLSNRSNSDFYIVNTCSYNLDICNNINNDGVISINGNIINAINEGNTDVIVYSNTDGYINKININVIASHYITFNSNTGNGIMDNQLFEYNESNNINLNTFTKEGYIFDHWNTLSDNSGTSYQDEELVNISSNITLYAIWRPISYTIVFDSNTGSGVMDSIKLNYDESISLPECSFTNGDLVFMHWNTSNDDSLTSYNDLSNITNLTTVDGSVITLYAIWGTEVTVEVSDYTLDEDNNYINKIPVLTSLNDYLSNISVNDSYTIEVDTKNVNGNSVLYTGSKTRIKDGDNVVYEFTNIVSGDTNGDGIVTYMDYVKVYNHIYKESHPDSNKNLLQDIYFLAGDMSNNNKIDYMDYVKVYNWIKNN